MKREQAQLVLHSQVFRFNDIFDQLPAKKNMRKKIYFQSELVQVENGTAVFAIAAYPAWCTASGWVIGKKVQAAESGNGSVVPLKEPIGFANNEMPLAGYKLKKKQVAKKIRKDYLAFERYFRRIARDPKLAANAIFRCHPGISENPHLEFDVTLESEGTAVRWGANPAPPGKPSF
jgi:hypothetical protein